MASERLFGVKVYKCSVSPRAGWRPLLSLVFVDSLWEQLNPHLLSSVIGVSMSHLSIERVGVICRQTWLSGVHG